MKRISTATWHAIAVLLAGWALPAAAQFSTPTPTLVAPRFSIEQATSLETLVAGSVVEFTVTVRNTGGGVADPGVVTVRYSSGLLPADAGAAYSSQGSYDSARGEWEVGILGPIGEAVLVLTATVAAQALDPCEFSLAELWPDGPDGYAQSQKAFATLRTPGIERCVDLVAGSAGDPARGIWNCDDGVTFRVPVVNLGPDLAQDALVSVEQAPELLPGLVFTDPRCDPPGEATCRLPLLAPSTLDWASWLELGSAAYRNRAPTELVVTVSINSPATELGFGDEEATRTLTVNPPDPCPDFGVGIDVGVPGCFIATAAWGSPLNAHVQSLRLFRDRHLLTHAPGRAFVSLYYRFSPPVADYIATRPVLRAGVRGLLWPFVFAVEQPRLCLALIVLFSAAALRMRRRRTAGSA